MNPFTDPITVSHYLLVGVKEAEAKVAKAKAYVSAAENELLSKKSERIAKEQKAQVDIDYATASYRKALTDIAKAERGYE